MLILVLAISFSFLEFNQSKNIFEKMKKEKVIKDNSITIEKGTDYQGYQTYGNDEIYPDDIYSVSFLCFLIFILFRIMIMLDDQRTKILKLQLQLKLHLQLKLPLKI